MQTGRRIWQCELSLIDTALLIAGMLSAASYFDGDGDAEEIEIRTMADALYRRVDWRAPGRYRSIDQRRVANLLYYFCGLSALGLSSVPL